jgi:hypothetical protein
MGRDLSRFMNNARLLTVSLCYLHLERIDDLIARNGQKPRYLESRRFFEIQLQRCLEKREAKRPDFGE